MNFKKGDHLTTPLLGILKHHGIYVGKNYVIEKTHRGVKHSSLDEFSEGSEISIVEHKQRKFSRHQAVIRAFSRIGESEYNVIFDNCEQFVNWCIDGIPKSNQVEATTIVSYKSIEMIYKSLKNESIIPDEAKKYIKMSPDVITLFSPGNTCSDVITAVLYNFLQEENFIIKIKENNNNILFQPSTISAIIEAFSEYRQERRNAKIVKAKRTIDDEIIEEQPVKTMIKTIAKAAFDKFNA